MAPDTKLTFEDVLGCQEASFEWAESFDSKDWSRLRACIAPRMRLTDREMSADDFVNRASDVSFLGNPKLMTQHFIGASKWTKHSDDSITGVHQLRVAHQKFKDETQTEVIKGHDHGSATIAYLKIEGVWKLQGLTPQSRWKEYDFDKIFGP